ncbi:hypothetical protein GCM10009847_17290 [Leucobacter tardus]
MKFLRKRRFGPVRYRADANAASSDSSGFSIGDELRETSDVAATESITESRSVGAHVTLMADYSAAVPLWGENGMIDTAGVLPRELEELLHSWSDVFDEHYATDSGWPSLELCRAQYAEGVRLRDLLERHFGSATCVRFDFWERTVCGVEIPLNKIHLH